jgi:3-hydroxypropanoate dehydrogenase
MSGEAGGESRILSDSGLDLLFRDAHTTRAWRDRPVPETLLRALWDLVRLGPTSTNCLPARIVFLASPGAKARLEPHLDKGNVAQSMSAPVTAILAEDTRFFEHLPELAPGKAKLPAWFESNPKEAAETLRRNSSLMGGYMILAARALGLDCGPMGGFSAEGINAEFFPDGRWKVNFLCNLGFGDPEAGRRPRAPRLSFADACRIL